MGSPAPLMQRESTSMSSSVCLLTGVGDTGFASGPDAARQISDRNVGIPPFKVNDQCGVGFPEQAKTLKGALPTLRCTHSRHGLRFCWLCANVHSTLVRACVMHTLFMSCLSRAHCRRYDARTLGMNCVSVGRARMCLAHCLQVMRPCLLCAHVSCTLSSC